jgi:Arc/MetJ family transcription regulator
MRTNIIIDDNLMNKALRLSGLGTKKAVVEEALELYVLIKNQRKLKQLRGKLRWEGDIVAMRTE